SGLHADGTAIHEILELRDPQDRARAWTAARHPVRGRHPPDARLAARANGRKGVRALFTAMIDLWGEKGSEPFSSRRPTCGAVARKGLCPLALDSFSSLGRGSKKALPLKTGSDPFFEKGL